MNKEERWHYAMNNLIERRKNGKRSSSSAYSPAGDYKKHIDKVYIGDTVLDVGCGDMNIKKHLPPHTEYYGIDAFPVNDEVVKADIENFNPKQIPGYLKPYFDTIILFAVLDGVCDLEKALQNISKLAAINILILTGIGIEPDEYHTHEVTFDILNRNLQGFKQVRCEELEPKVYLIEYARN